jgi:type VI secretion system protein ImpE
MTAIELFRAGKLREAIDVQVATVKAAPADQAARLALFELFLFTGELDRARKQLEVLRYDDPRQTAAIEQYRHALDAEACRRRVFAGTDQPKIPASAPEHVRQRVEVLAYLARGEAATARARLDEANAAIPQLAGTFDGKPFEGISDGDDRLGTVLEVFASSGVYSWLPLEQVHSIVMNPPQSPRDLVLRPANITLIDGTSGDVFLPGLYPDTSTHPDDEVRLGRAAVWVETDAGVFQGSGGRVFQVGSEWVPFSTVNELLITAAS